ncbi:YeiH family protein [Hutsoniella sourekii]|uniref:YeiH family protein n=1 Tax=Hutsoniella sourekii TaxID=87650 RepID=UPI000482D597|nr:YeiH family protein [Hutsoniella sourekii]
MLQKNQLAGLGLALLLAVPAWLLGQQFPVVGGPVFAILIGMVIRLFWEPTSQFQPGVQFVSKKVLQYAVVLLGFGLNLHVILETGLESLPIIISTILTALIVAYIMTKQLNLDPEIGTLVGVGSSICGGSAIAATAPVIEADEEKVAQSISVIFFFNLLAALLFPMLGQWLGFDTTSGGPFGIFAGTAVNDTSSVTAAASTWDTMFNLGTQTLDKAVTVKLTRTLAIIPITLGLGWWRNRQAAKTSGVNNNDESFGQKIMKALPTFIIYFVLASIITTVAISMGVPESIFSPFSKISKFFIVMAMAAIGLNTDLIKLLKTGSKALIVGAVCWVSIIIVSLGFQHVLGLW